MEMTIVIPDTTFPSPIRSPYVKRWRSIVSLVRRAWCQRVLPQSLRGGWLAFPGYPWCSLIPTRPYPGEARYSSCATAIHRSRSVFSINPSWSPPMAWIDRLAPSSGTIGMRAIAGGGIRIRTTRRRRRCGR